MFKLIRHIKGYGLYAFFGPLLKLLEALMETFVPFIMSGIIDKGIKQGDSAYVLRQGALLVLIAALGWIFAISAQFFNAKASMGFGLNLRTALFDKILSMDMETVDRFTIPSLITRTTTDVTRAQTGLNMFLRLILRNPFIVAGAIIMSGVINVRVMIIYIILVPLIALFFYLTLKFARPFYKRITSLIDSISTFCRENIIGVRSVRAFGMQKKECADFEEKTSDLFENQVKADRISALTTPLNTLLVNACVILVLIIGSSFVNGGKLLNGSIIALVNYLFQILLSVGRTATLMESFNKANVSSARIKEVLDCENTPLKSTETASSPEKVNETPEYEGGAYVAVEAPESEQNDNIASNTAAEASGTPFVAFDNVSFSYGRNGKYSLSGISFEVEKGASLGIIGGTGSGKTTLVNLLQGIYPATEGRVIIDGKDVAGIPAAELTKYFSTVPQKSILFAGTVKENIMFGNPSATDEDIKEALENSVSDEFVYKKEGGLSFLVEYGGRNLSGGQKQRLTLARAFVRDAEILVLDDSTSALDYVTESKIRKYVTSGKTRASTKIIVSQRISAVSVCDRILVLDEGKAAGFGTHEELLETCDTYKEIWLSQTGDLGEED
ncbi:MAG: ABC transporter ATP-binding protein [Clostridia bacterium]|nr:ABC transporter ATP-binding protein [Clostridia bacterium]MBR5006890.1 ABC transporter ATP-binding protein [Clostridia bacterium]